MLGLKLLKQYFHDFRKKYPDLQKIESPDALLVKVYNILLDEYGVDCKDTAKEIAMSLWSDYGILYR